MILALEIVFALAVAFVAASAVAVAYGRAHERLLLAAAVGFAALAGAVLVVLGINLVESFAQSDALLLLVGGFSLAAVAEGCLYLLARGRRRAQDLDQVHERARANLEAWLAEHAEQRKAELERTLAHERGNAGYVLGEQERRLAEERRDQVARQAERARVELTEAVGSAQERLESRLTAWAADLDRGQRELESQFAELDKRQRQAFATYDARLRADAERVAVVSEEQKKALAQLRAEFERVAAAAFEESRSEIETHAAERRRSLHEVGERLRARERALREQIDREEAEARSRLAAGLAEAEQRQIAQLERVIDRVATRLTDDAERRFDVLIRESRDKSAERLSRELDKSIEMFARRAEKDVSERINELAKITAERMQRRVNDVARASEAQHEVAADRVRLLSERLNEALAAAEDRLAAFETQIELELEAKLGSLDRALRTGERE
jgi:hypothetical protein